MQWLHWTCHIRALGIACVRPSSGRAPTGGVLLAALILAGCYTQSQLKAFRRLDELESARTAGITIDNRLPSTTEQGADVRLRRDMEAVLRAVGLQIATAADDPDILIEVEVRETHVTYVLESALETPWWTPTPDEQAKVFSGVSVLGLASTVSQRITTPAALSPERSRVLHKWARGGMRGLFRWGVERPLPKRLTMSEYSALRKPDPTRFLMTHYDTCDLQTRFLSGLCRSLAHVSSAVVPPSLGGRTSLRCYLAKRLIDTARGSTDPSIREAAQRVMEGFRERGGRYVGPVRDPTRRPKTVPDTSGGQK